MQQTYFDFWTFYGYINIQLCLKSNIPAIEYYIIDNQQ